MQKHQGFSSIALIIIVVLVIGGGYWVWKKQTVTPPSALPEVEGTSTSPLGGGSEGVEGWKTYRNEQYGFEVKYPNEIVLEEKGEVVNLHFFNNHIQFYASNPVHSCYGGDIDLELDPKITLKDISFYHRDSYFGGVMDKNLGHGYVGERISECYRFALITDYPPAEPQAHALMDQIVSTFRFTK